MLSHSLIQGIHPYHMPKKTEAQRMLKGFPLCVPTCFGPSYLDMRAESSLMMCPLEWYNYVASWILHSNA